MMTDVTRAHLICKGAGPRHNADLAWRVYIALHEHSCVDTRSISCSEQQGTQGLSEAL